MTETATIDNAVRKAKLPAFVLDRRWLVDVDSQGEEAIWLWLIVPEDKSLSPEEWLGIWDSVRQALAKAGIPLWAYVRYRTEQEQAEIDADHEPRR